MLSDFTFFFSPIVATVKDCCVSANEWTLFAASCDGDVNDSVSDTMLEVFPVE